MTKTSDSNILGLVKSYWAIIVFLCTFIFTIANFSSIQAQQSDAIDANTKEIEQLRQTYNDINVRLATIQERVDFIKDRVK